MDYIEADDEVTLFWESLGSGYHPPFLVVQQFVTQGLHEANGVAKDSCYHRNQ